jgi:ABC-2 type transport system permease protein
MNRLIHAEALKLRSTRTFYAVTLGALALIVVAVTAMSAANSFHTGDSPARETLAIAGLAQTFALVLGVLAVTGEFRHGTISSALLITPKRTPVLTSKLITLSLAGLVFGLVAFGCATAIVMPVLSLRGVASQVDATDIIAIIAGGTVATALFAALGVGVGTVVRNQAGAIIAAFALVYVIEPILTILPGVGNAAQTFGLGGLASAASRTTPLHAGAHILAQGSAVLLLAAYALAFLAAGAALLRRRDIRA